MTWNDGENGPAFEKWMGFEIRGIISKGDSQWQCSFENSDWKPSLEI
jgi:hypothetical protein